MENRNHQLLFMVVKKILIVVLVSLPLSFAWAIPTGFDEQILSAVRSGQIAQTDITPEDKKDLGAHVIFRTFVPGKTEVDYINVVTATADYQKFLKSLILKSSNLEEIRDQRDSEKVKNENKLSILPNSKFDLTVKVALKNLSFGANIDVFFDVFRAFGNEKPGMLVQEWLFRDKSNSNLFKKYTLPMREITKLVAGELDGKKGLFIEDDVSISLRKRIQQADLLSSLKGGLIDSFEQLLKGIRSKLLASQS